MFRVLFDGERSGGYLRVSAFPQATHIIVTGGLYIGDINTPFPNNATIRLFGDRTTPSQQLSGVDLGSKVRGPCYRTPFCFNSVYVYVCVCVSVGCACVRVRVYVCVL